MHIEFLIEDVSGKAMLEFILPVIIPQHTWRIISYKGVGGKIPSGLRNKPETAKHRILLDNILRLLSGYGKTYSHNEEVAVVFVCDLDKRNKDDFLSELTKSQKQYCPYLNVRFILAIEEGEAWFLGDVSAIKKAYPHCKMAVIHSYVQDSICGTWEKLADALYPGGAQKLKEGGYQVIGKEKMEWAINISPQMDVECNQSPSFCNFRDTVRDLPH